MSLTVQVPSQRRQYRFSHFAELLLCLLLLVTTPPDAFSHCHHDPDQASFGTEAMAGWDLTATGLVAIYYRHEGLLPDHVTFHRIVQQGFESGSTDELRLSFGPTVTILQADTTTETLPYVYVIVSQPLYYGTAIDSLGLARDIWIDHEEDGLNGNEQKARLDAY